LRHKSFFDRLAPEDQHWVRRTLFRVLGVYACLMMLLVAGAGLRIGVVEPLVEDWTDLPTVGETDSRYAAALSEPASGAPCAPPACAKGAAVDYQHAADGLPVWATLGAD
jgi:hypothetical protein